MTLLAAQLKRNIVSEGFDLSQSNRMRACVQVLPQEIITAVFSAENELQYLKHYSFKPAEKTGDSLTHLIQAEPFFSQTFESVVIGLSSSCFTFVPAPLFQQKNMQDWLAFNHEIPKGSVVLQDELKSCDSRLVYAVPEGVKNSLDRSFPNNITKCYMSSLVENLSAGRLRKCSLDIHPAAFDLILSDGKLVMANTFLYESAEDLLYFLLASLQQNNFKPAETEVILSGEIESGSALHELLKEYIPHLKFAVMDKSILLKEEFISLPHHFYHSLFNLYLCAL